MDSPTTLRRVSVFDWLLSRASELGGVGLLVMTGVVCLDVVMRKFFGGSIFWADELAEYLLTVVVALGFAYTLKAGGHIQIEILAGRLSDKALKKIRPVWCILGVLYVGLLTSGVWQLALESWRNGTRSMSLTLPLAPFQSVLVIGLFLILLELVAELVASLR